MSKITPEDLLSGLLTQARKLGADAADARWSQRSGLGVEVRNGALETVERDEAASVSLRALVGRRQAHVSGTDLSPEGFSALAERVVAMAKAAPEDPWCGVPDAAELARDHPDLELECDEDPDPALLEARALAAESAALSVKEVAQTGHAGASWSSGETVVAASNGFIGRRRSGTVSIGLVAIAQRDGAMERDHDSRTERRGALLPDPAEIGLEAARRAVARLGPRKLSSRTAAVIFENRLASRLLGAFIGAIGGPTIARGVSFLKDRMGAQVFAPGVDIIDDPLRRHGFGSRAFDGEGRQVRRTAIIKDGVLTQWLLNGPSARQLKLKPNGFASMGFGDPPGVSTSNIDIAPGRRTLSQLMSDAGEGLLVTDMFGPSLNPNTGDYSVGVSGYWFENGERAYPVSEVTVAGDLPSMFVRMVPGSDLEIRSAANAPSLLIDGMALAGQ